MFPFVADSSLLSSLSRKDTFTRKYYDDIREFDTNFSETCDVVDATVSGEKR